MGLIIIIFVIFIIIVVIITVIVILDHIHLFDSQGMSALPMVNFHSFTLKNLGPTLVPVGHDDDHGNDDIDNDNEDGHDDDDGAHTI